MPSWKAVARTSIAHVPSGGEDGEAEARPTFAHWRRCVTPFALIGAWPQICARGQRDILHPSRLSLPGARCGDRVELKVDAPTLAIVKS